MNHQTCQILNTCENDTTREPVASRRKFFKMLSGGAAALALQGCGAGGVLTLTLASDAPATPAPTTPTTPPAPTPPTVPPVTTTPPGSDASVVWQSIPQISFTQGVPSVFSVADYITVANASLLSLTLSTSTLPVGVTFDSNARAFIYDGSGAVAATDGVVLTATAG